MSRRFPPEVHQFLRENVVGRTNPELLELVNRRFGDIFTASQLKAYKANHKLKGGDPNKKKPGEGSIYPPEIHAFIQENYQGTGPSQMQRIVNNTFHTNYTVGQLKSYYARYKLNSGVTGYFEEGHTPFNKGRKGYVAPGAEKGWFKRGHTPTDTAPVGTIQTKADGYLWKKINDEPYVGIKNWRQLHILNWEEANGPVPEGHMVVFKDKNPMNCDIENLALLTRSDNAVMNRWSLRPTNPDFFETGKLVAQIKKEVKRRK